MIRRIFSTASHFSNLRVIKPSSQLLFRRLVHLFTKVNIYIKSTNSNRLSLSCMDFELSSRICINLCVLPACKSSERAKVRPFLTYSTIFTGVGVVVAATKQNPVNRSKMATPLSDLLQNADQLFDENQFQETLDVLSKHEVLFYT